MRARAATAQRPPRQRPQLATPPAVDPEVALLLANLADARLATLSGAAGLRRVAQEIATDAYLLGLQQATPRVARSRHGLTVLSLSEYARRVGISKRTALRRVQDGDVVARRTGAGWIVEETGR